MARDLSQAKQKFLGAVRGIYSSAVFGANATSLTVEELQRIIQKVLSSYVDGRDAWNDLRTLMGDTEARTLLAQTVDSPPTDISVQLSTVRLDVIALLDAYQTQFSAGTPNKTFSYSSGDFSGGFSDIAIASGVLTNVNSLCSTLQASVETITPVS